MLDLKQWHCIFFVLPCPLKPTSISHLGKPSQPLSGYCAVVSDRMFSPTSMSPPVWLEQPKWASHSHQSIKTPCSAVDSPACCTSFHLAMIWTIASTAPSHHSILYCSNEFSALDYTMLFHKATSPCPLTCFLFWFTKEHWHGFKYTV